MAPLKAEPESREWHKGFAKAMSKDYRKSEFTPELNAEILEQLKKAIVIDPNDLFLQFLYILKKSEVQAENDEEIQISIERELEPLKPKTWREFQVFFSITEKIPQRECFKKERGLENFSTSTKVLKIVANLYKLKAFLMKDDVRKGRLWLGNPFSCLRRLSDIIPIVSK